MSPGQRWEGWAEWRKPSPVVVTQEATRKPEPMTPAQAALLKALCADVGEKFNPTLSKRRASLRIAQLKRRTK